MSKVTLAASLFAALTLTGCASPIGHFTVISGNNVSGLDSVSTNVGQASTRVSGESCRDLILFIPVSSSRNIDDAFSDAIRKAPGANALSDVTLKRDGLFTLFFTKQCFTVEGTPIKLGK
jgi:hypothetical protein